MPTVDLVRRVRSPAGESRYRKPIGSYLNDAEQDKYQEARESGYSHAQAMRQATSGRGGQGGTQEQFEQHLDSVKSLQPGQTRQIGKGSVTKVGSDYHVTVGGKTLKYPKYADDATRALMNGRHRASGVPVPKRRNMSQVGTLSVDLAVPPVERQGSRRRLARAGKALKDGSFPMPNVAYLKKAIQAVGRASAGKRPALARLIRKRGRELGAMDIVNRSWAGKQPGTAAMSAALREAFELGGMPPERIPLELAATEQAFALEFAIVTTGGKSGVDRTKRFKKGARLGAGGTASELAPSNQKTVYRANARKKVRQAAASAMKFEPGSPQRATALKALSALAHASMVEPHPSRKAPTRPASHMSQGAWDHNQGRPAQLRGSAWKMSPEALARQTKKSTPSRRNANAGVSGEGHGVPRPRGGGTTQGNTSRRRGKV